MTKTYKFKELPFNLARQFGLIIEYSPKVEYDYISYMCTEGYRREVPFVTRIVNRDVFVELTQDEIDTAIKLMNEAMDNVNKSLPYKFDVVLNDETQKYIGCFFREINSLGYAAISYDHIEEAQLGLEYSKL